MADPAATGGGRHPHVPELQSIRGIAAAAVLLAHAGFVFDTTPRFRYATEVVFNAHAALVTFFVLSGFVLARSLSGSHFGRRSIARFYLRRLFRIYPVFAAASALGWAYVLLLATRCPTPHGSVWGGIVGWGQVRPGWAALARTALVPGSGLVPPLWTIHFELVASLLLPLLWWLTRSDAATLGLLGGTAWLVHWSHPQGEVVASFLFSFALGVAAMRYGTSRLVRALPGWTAWAALAVLVAFRRLSHGWDFERDYLAVLPTLVESAAAALLVLWAAHRPGGRLLRHPRLVRLGDVSYSLYAYHMAIAFALAKLPAFGRVGANAAALALMALTAAIGVPLAAFSYARLELPAIALGNRLLARWLGPRRA